MGASTFNPQYVATQGFKDATAPLIGVLTDMSNERARAAERAEADRKWNITNARLEEGAQRERDAAAEKAKQQQAANELILRSSRNIGADVLGYNVPERDAINTAAVDAWNRTILNSPELRSLDAKVKEAKTALDSGVGSKEDWYSAIEDLRQGTMGTQVGLSSSGQPISAAKALSDAYTSYTPYKEEARKSVLRQGAELGVNPDALLTLADKISSGYTSESDARKAAQEKANQAYEDAIKERAFKLDAYKANNPKSTGKGAPPSANAISNSYLTGQAILRASGEKALENEGSNSWLRTLDSDDVYKKAYNFPVTAMVNGKKVQASIQDLATEKKIPLDDFKGIVESSLAEAKVKGFWGEANPTNKVQDLITEKVNKYVGKYTDGRQFEADELVRPVIGVPSRSSQVEKILGNIFPAGSNNRLNPPTSPQNPPRGTGGGQGTPALQNTSTTSLEALGVNPTRLLEEPYNPLVNNNTPVAARNEVPSNLDMVSQGIKTFNTNIDNMTKEEVAKALQSLNAPISNARYNASDVNSLKRVLKQEVQSELLRSKDTLDVNRALTYVPEFTRSITNFIEDNLGDFKSEEELAKVAKERADLLSSYNEDRKSKERLSRVLEQVAKGVSNPAALDGLLADKKTASQASTSGGLNEVNNAQIISNEQLTKEIPKTDNYADRLINTAGKQLGRLTDILEFGIRPEDNPSIGRLENDYYGQTYVPYTPPKVTTSGEVQRDYDPTVKGIMDYVGTNEGLAKQVVKEALSSGNRKLQDQVMQALAPKHTELVKEKFKNFYDTSTSELGNSVQKQAEAIAKSLNISLGEAYGIVMEQLRKQYE